MRTSSAGSIRRSCADPENVELNLRYADLALQQGHRRKALAAYERVLDVDPGNQAARSGLRSINVGLTPAVTRGRVELGARWESNVRELPKTTNRPDDLVGFAKLFVTDERPLFNNVWQSDLWAYADIHDDVSASTTGSRGRIPAPCSISAATPLCMSPPAAAWLSSMPTISIPRRRSN